MVKSKAKLNESAFFEEEKGCTLTVYQGRKEKNVALLSSFHEKVSTNAELPNLPNIIETYNKTKVGVDLIDNMTRLCSVRCKSRRWTVVFFFNVLNMSGINSWILYKKCNNSQISRRDFLKGLVEELFELVHPKEENNSIPTPSTPKTPSQNKKRSLFLKYSSFIQKSEFRFKKKMSSTVMQR